MPFSTTPISALVMILGSALGLGTPLSASPLLPPIEWELRSPTPGAPPCRAVKFGPAIDTQLLRNRAGDLILVAGHGDWSHDGDPFALTISADGAPPMRLTGYPIGPTIFVLVEDDALEKQIKAAHTLDWRLPWGQFRAEVEGLGKAFDALTVCPG